jgi:hypothetical protein
MPNEIHSYSELQHQIREALRIQHPEWVEPMATAPRATPTSRAWPNYSESVSAQRR